MNTNFIIFNDDCKTIINVSLIDYLWIGGYDNTILNIFIAEENIELNYDNKNKVLKDYKVLVSVLNAKNLFDLDTAPKIKRKPSLKQQAMKEVNEFLGKNKK